EFVYEGYVTDEWADEGPFLDLTDTYDAVRKQRVLKITKIHHRDKAIHHILLPGGLEHKMLMGMPREPTIFNEVNKVSDCVDVNITPGGCSWLHGVVSIKKKSDSEVSAVIDSAFNGHKSMKHVVVVDADIDVNNMLEVEWAIATRVQGDRDIYIKKNQKGSSLDPSSDPNTRITSKVGIDATIPVRERGKGKYEKGEYKKVELKDYF
ncbi:UbiD family decarboxylase, partial [Candidatus Micrarchaeota archaeon]|nr:UbiD family decarboxylase [Candidatus Micrarchaeota archaeon]